MSHEQRPSDGQGALVGAIVASLAALFMLCSTLDAVRSMILFGVGGATRLINRGGVMLVFAGAAAFLGWQYSEARKKFQAWKDGGGEARLAEQMAAQRGAQIEAERRYMADLEARGVRFLAAYPIRQAQNERERYVDSVLGPQLRQGEVVIDRAYGFRGARSRHFLIGATNQRVFYLETTFLGFGPAMKCDSLEVVELAELARVQWDAGPLHTGIGLVKKSGETVGIQIPTVQIDTGFSNQGGFASRFPAWAKQTVDLLLQGASLWGAAPASAPRVSVRWPDGSNIPAEVMQSSGEQCLCRFGDGSERWIPRALIAG